MATTKKDIIDFLFSFEGFCAFCAILFLWDPWDLKRSSSSNNENEINNVVIVEDVDDFDFSISDVMRKNINSLTIDDIYSIGCSNSNSSKSRQRKNAYSSEITSIKLRAFKKKIVKTRLGPWTGTVLDVKSSNFDGRPYINVEINDSKFNIKKWEAGLWFNTTKNSVEKAFNLSIGDKIEFYGYLEEERQGGYEGFKSLGSTDCLPLTEVTENLSRLPHIWFKNSTWRTK